MLSCSMSSIIRKLEIVKIYKLITYDLLQGNLCKMLSFRPSYSKAKIFKKVEYAKIIFIQQKQTKQKILVVKV